MSQATTGSPSSSHPARGGHRAVRRQRLRVVPGDVAPGALRAGTIAPGYRIWLHVDGVRMFGPGTQELLERVDATGSLHQAALLMGMSYTKAWRLLRETEEHLGIRLVERHVGGATGGGTSLTARGRDVVRRFAAFTEAADGAMREAFERFFGDLGAEGRAADCGPGDGGPPQRGGEA